MRHESQHRVVIATQGACTTYQHWIKVWLFGVSGFSFLHYGNLIILLSGAMIVGTAIGKRILITFPADVLQLAMKAIVTLLGGRLILDGLGFSIFSMKIGSWPGIVTAIFVLCVGIYAGFQLKSRNAKVRHIRQWISKRKNHAAKVKK